MGDLMKCVDVLNKKGFIAMSVPNADTAIEKVLELIGSNETVGAGGSMTLGEIGVTDALLERGSKVYSSAAAKKIGMDKEEARKLAMTADWFLSSTNAVTLRGEFLNIDAIGNRVAGMFYGPEKVIIIAGKNKITSNIQTARKRIKQIACPLNAKRLKLDTPCAKTGKCTDCDSPGRMCNVTVRLDYPTWGRQFYVILIDGDFGY